VEQWNWRARAVSGQRAGKKVAQFGFSKVGHPAGFRFSVFQPSILRNEKMGGSRRKSRGARGLELFAGPKSCGPPEGKLVRPAANQPSYKKQKILAAVNAGL
jgi:hypothetical protein